MPEDLLGRMFARAGLREESLVSYQTARRKRFFEMLGTCRFTALIRLPDRETLCEGGVKVALSEMMRTGALYYTKEEYLEHIAAILDLLRRFPRYRRTSYPAGIPATSSMCGRDSRVRIQNICAPRGAGHERGEYGCRVLGYLQGMVWR
jgi:hypothetical protein